MLGFAPKLSISFIKNGRSLLALVLRLSPLALAGCGPAHLQHDVNASERRYLLGADLFQKNMLAPAMEELTKAVELNTDNADAHNLLGLVYLRKAVEGEELFSRSQCLRGDALSLEKQGADADFVKAEKEFRAAVKIRPDFSEAHNNLTVVAQHFGRFDEAISEAESALSNIAYREAFAAEGNLGLAYTSKGDLVRAAAQLRKAVFEQPKFCVGHFRLAEVYKQQNELDQARSELDLVFADKSCPIQEAYHLGGIVWLKLGDRDHSRELFRHCVELAPKSCLARECTLAGSP